MAENSDITISPCRGEYYICDKDSSELLKMAVYPVPPLDGSGLGVHLTPTINGNILIGPSAEYIQDKTDDCNTKNTMDQLKKEAFELLPQLKDIQFIKNYSGIRPKLFNSKSNKNFEDFIIEESKNVSDFINLIGIESPGLTSATSIAKFIFEQIISIKHELKMKKNYILERKGIIKTNCLQNKDLKKLIKKDKNYGEIVCRCQQISKGEIISSLNNPLKSRTMNSIKKRTSVMMGRCQGGYCIPKISKILTDEFKMPPEKIIKNSKGSNFFEGYLN